MTLASGRERPASPPPELAVREIAAACGGVVVRGDPEASARGVTVDSRAVSPGMLFVALRGERTDGHRFAAEACRRGAAAVLGALDVPDVPPEVAMIVVPDTLHALHALARSVRDRQGLRVIGITGSVGKTSTKELTAALAGRMFRTVRSPRNWNTEIGIPLVLANVPRDAEVAVVELAMRGPGQIRELVAVSRPEIGVVTNVGESHLDFFDGREALAEEKSVLVEGLPADGVAILNADDALVLAMRRRTPARVLTFGLRAGDVTASAIRVLPGEGSAFRLRTPAGEAEVLLHLPGRHAVLNALAAAAAGVALGVPVGEIALGLGGASMLPMRLAVRRVGEVTLVDDTYNSSPQSIEAALDVVDELPGAPRIAVLGDMRELGAASGDAHRRVGRLVAGRRLDLVIAFGPLAAELAESATEAGGVRVTHTLDPIEVLRLLRRELRPGAVVLIKGSRALEMERIVAGLEGGAGVGDAALRGRGLAWA
ncbi:MAG TPA: UDP-N-acetylmuramoyl-tripeptide--D-alanyl-D-alanine ligase [bacterium]|nr:UDP-N-acetylmuramoyl-tripeptide--D-alanyl-D-alanine ligase [bacterium]